MKIVTVSCRSDNYAYLVICEQTMRAAVVDPSESAPVLAAIKREGVRVEAIWNTHHHFDHVGGNEAIVGRFPECQVLAHASDRGRVPCQTGYLDDGDGLTLGTEVRAEVIFNPGHTRGAISYYLESTGVVFTGDTLFGAGCGRLFEGSAEQMHSSLTRLTSLSAATKVYCGHEYTEANLRFALEVNPGNVEIAERMAAVAVLRGRGESTMGFTVAQELATNVFVRTKVAEVETSAHRERREAFRSPWETFAALRSWKDHY